MRQTEKRGMIYACFGLERAGNGDAVPIGSAIVLILTSLVFRWGAELEEQKTNH